MPMITRQDIDQKREEIINLARHYGAHDVRLFGSFARGDATETSDVDLLVRLDPDRSLFDLGGLLMDLRELLGAEVDLVSEGSLYGQFGAVVSKEAIPL